MEKRKKHKHLNAFMWRGEGQCERHYLEERYP